MYTQLLRSILFYFDAETAHRITFNLIKWRSLLPLSYQKINDNKIYFNREGLLTDSPLGLAAGFDKNAELIDFWFSLGFGFVEIGTVTPKPQEGNPKPRLYRLLKDEAIINRMGFNNLGAVSVKKNLERRKSNKAVGVNIGKNKITPNEDAWRDYLYCLEVFHDNADYFAVNVSSPNTPGLRELQSKEALKKILGELQNKNQYYVKPKPLFLKLAPDLSKEAIAEACNVAIECHFAGVIMGNTTISRNGLKSNEAEINNAGEGGLSGKPLRKLSDEQLKFTTDNFGDKLIVMGCGGVFYPKDVEEKLKLGAHLVQTYTGFVYQGPALPLETYKAFKKS